MQVGNCIIIQEGLYWNFGLLRDTEILERKFVQFISFPWRSSLGHCQTLWIKVWSLHRFPTWNTNLRIARFHRTECFHKRISQVIRNLRWTELSGVFEDYFLNLQKAWGLKQDWSTVWYNYALRHSLGNWSEQFRIITFLVWSKFQTLVRDVTWVVSGSNKWFIAQVRISTIPSLRDRVHAIRFHAWALSYRVNSICRSMA